MSTSASALTRVCVWPEDESTLIEAVDAAGGMIVPADQAEVLVSFNGSVDRMRAVLHPGIKLIQLGSVGIEKWFSAGLIDNQRQWAAGHGIYSVAMAEHVLALILCAACDLPRRIRATTWGRHEWGDPGGHRLIGRSVGIVGCGGVGRALIGLLRPFNARVLALTRSGAAVAGASESLNPGGLKKLLVASDYIVVAAPSTRETRGLISSDALRLMRPTAWLINVARGSLVDTGALVRALEKGQLAGAALDVIDPEPLPDGHKLWSMPNVVITPHVACPRDICLQLFGARILENLKRYRNGEVLLGKVDPTQGY